MSSTAIGIKPQEYEIPEKVCVEVSRFIFEGISKGGLSDVDVIRYITERIDLTELQKANALFTAGRVIQMNCGGSAL